MASGAPASVKVRRHGSYNFEAHYDSLCALQDSVPLTEVKSHLLQGVLDANADRIRLSDWPPIIKTLSINRNLQYVAFRSYVQLSKSKDAKKHHHFRRRMPAICSRDLTYRLTSAIKQCIQSSTNITCLELQGIHLSNRDVHILAQGLQENKSLVHLSLEYCGFSDKGCEVLCQALRNHRSITHINFSGCNLTWKGAEMVAKLLTFQSTVRHSEAWADSLRYGHPDVDGMRGLRRITVNNNPMIGDAGVQSMAESLKDDMWLKALDIQNCGVSRDGAELLLNMLTENTTLVVLDIRQNPLIDRPLVHSVLEKVLMNSNGNDVNEFPWLSAEQPTDPYRANPRKLRKHTSIYSKRRLSTGSRSFDSMKDSCLPRHTASRAKQYKKMYTDGRHSAIPRYLENAEIGQVTIHVDEESTFEDIAGDVSPIKQTKSANDLIAKSPVKITVEGYEQRVKALKANLKECNQLLQEEMKARRTAEQRAINFEIKNIQLEKDVLRLKKQISEQADPNNDEFFDQVENSLKQFHNFLDILNSLGLGGLAAYAGISNMEFPERKEPMYKTKETSTISIDESAIDGKLEG